MHMFSRVTSLPPSVSPVYEKAGEGVTQSTSKHSSKHSSKHAANTLPDTRAVNCINAESVLVCGNEAATTSVPVSLHPTRQDILLSTQ